jgi:hypothetical protein
MFEINIAAAVLPIGSSAAEDIVSVATIAKFADGEIHLMDGDLP